MRRSRRSRLAAPLALLCVVAIAGCGSSNSSSATKKASKVPASSTPSGTSTGAAGGSGASHAADPKVEALVPKAIKAKGTLMVASDASYAPNEFFAPDGHTVIGMDVDLIKAIGAVMGLKVTDQNATFDAIIPDLASGKFDVGISSFTDTKLREKTVDFVDYFLAGTSFFTKASGGTSVSGLSGICGLTVAVEKGTTELSDAQAQSAKCTKAGKKPVNVISFPDQNGANLALASGRAQIDMADSPVADYAVKKSNGQFKIVGPTYGTAPYGIALPKGDGMTKPVLAALQVLMKDGTYTKILSTWGVQEGAISKPKINGAIS